MNDDVFGKFSPNARRILVSAQKIAQSMDSALASEHILLALAVTPNTLAHSILKENLVGMDQIRLTISLNNFRHSAVGMTEEAKDILEIAAQKASQFSHHQIETEHLLLAIVSNPSSLAADIISRIGADPEKIKNQIENIFTDLSDYTESVKDQEDALSGFDQFMGPENLNAPLPPMDFPSGTMLPSQGKKVENFAYDLTAQAKDGKIDPLIGREKELERVIQILCRRTKNNPVLVGEPGVGKTAIVEGLAQKITDGTVPQKIAGKKLIMLDLGLLVAGTMYRGQFEDRIKKFLDELTKKGDSILFIDELHTIVGTGSAEGSLDLANILKPSLAKGKIHLIGATTTDEYRKFIEKDSALERRLQKVTVLEPSTTDTIAILKGIRANYEAHHQVKITDEAILAAVELSKRYIFDRNLPDKAIDLIDEAAAAWQIKHEIKDVAALDDLKKKLSKIQTQKNKEVSNQNFEKAAYLRTLEIRTQSEIQKIREKTVKKNKPQNAAIYRENIAQVLALWTNVPVEKLQTKERAKFLNISKHLKKYIIGQDEAIAGITKAIQRSKTGLNDPNRPIGSFIFLGPTGVGKTELAKVLAQELFGTRDGLIKIDMSEFMERHNLSRLVGAPPGYVGYDEAGKLTEQVRQKPYSLVLFDEIEKASPDVFNVLLQILEDGELTDAKGKRVNFRNTIIIMTSNIGMHKLNEQATIGFSGGKNSKTISSDYEKMKDEVIKDLKSEFRPELLNRLDKIIVFKSLGKKELLEITKLQLANLAQRMTQNKINIQFNSDVVKFIAEKGYDPKFGARPIRRAISEEIEDPLSEAILSGKFNTGGTIKINITNNKIAFTSASKKTSHLAKKMV